MEPMLILFSTAALLFLLRFLESQNFSLKWWFNGILSAILYTFSLSVKYVGFYSFLLGIFLILRHFWKILRNQNLTNLKLFFETFIKGLIFVLVPVGIYLSIFYVHLNFLYRAGPHDSVMTSAFQASLEGE